jgi:hypothetical protein
MIERSELLAAQFAEAMREEVRAGLVHTSRLHARDDDELGRVVVVWACNGRAEEIERWLDETAGPGVDMPTTVDESDVT